MRRITLVRSRAIAALAPVLAIAATLGGCQRSNDVVLHWDGVTTAGASSRAPVSPAAGAGAGHNGAGAATGTAGPPGAPAAGSGSAGQVAAGAGIRGTGSAGQTATGAAGSEPKSGAGATGAADGADGSAGQPASVDASQPAGGARDPDCDWNGIWIAKQVTVNEALGLPQSSNNWYYLELAQHGTAVEVTKHFDCGIEVRGSATVTLSRATTEALIQHNHQTGRKGTLGKEGATCAFEAARFWSIRGADELRYLPNEARDSTDSVDAVARAKPLPTTEATEGAVDTEADGKPGVAFQVTGVVTGVRNAVQRDWTRWFTAPGFEIAPSTDWPEDLTIRADFDNEESILDPTSGLLTSGSTPSASADHVLRLRFLGRDASDPRVAAIVKPTEVETCFAIQDALPAEAME